MSLVCHVYPGLPLPNSKRRLDILKLVNKISDLKAEESTKPGVFRRIIADLEHELEAQTKELKDVECKPFRRENIQALQTSISDEFNGEFSPEHVLPPRDIENLDQEIVSCRDGLMLVALEQMFLAENPDTFHIKRTFDESCLAVFSDIVRDPIRVHTFIERVLDARCDADSILALQSQHNEHYIPNESVHQHFRTPRD